MKVTSVSNPASLSLESQGDLNLFDDVLENEDLNRNGAPDGDDEMLDVNDDWIVDDMEGAHRAEPSKKVYDANVKEMGMLYN